jgi:hypothetical protein
MVIGHTTGLSGCGKTQSLTALALLYLPIGIATLFSLHPQIQQLIT